MILVLRLDSCGTTLIYKVGEWFMHVIIQVLICPLILSRFSFQNSVSYYRNKSQFEIWFSINGMGQNLLMGRDKILFLKITIFFFNQKPNLVSGFVTRHQTNSFEQKKEKEKKRGHEFFLSSYYHKRRMPKEYGLRNRVTESCFHFSIKDICKLHYAIIIERALFFKVCLSISLAWYYLVSLVLETFLSGNY